MSKAIAAENKLWSFKVPIAHIPDAGLQQVLDATPAQRAQLTSVAGVRDIPQASATFDVCKVVGERVQVTGRVTARVVQTCVVTLDQVENAIDEAIDVLFAPPSQIQALAKTVIRDDGEDAAIPDLPEPITDGMIDIGQLATEFLLLGIDPYPRKPGVTFDVPQDTPDPDEHPFAALKALKTGPDAPKGKKPKG